MHRREFFLAIAGAGLACAARGQTPSALSPAAVIPAPPSDAPPAPDAPTEVPPVKLDPANTVYMDLPYGRVVIRLRPDLAPKFVERVKQLCREHFYDGTPFHRVIDGFMAQGGDPTGTGMGGSKYPNVPAEFSESAHFLRGTVGAARSADPDSQNSQFFIMFGPKESLDGNYVIWGNVVSGMQYVDMIKKGDPDDNGKVATPDHIVKMRLATDPN
jgi:peptidylprolyl isomerase